MIPVSNEEFIEKYMGVLQPVEMFISSCYKKNPAQLYDFDVEKIFQALLKYIKAKLTDYPLPEPKLQGVSLDLYETIFDFLQGMEKSISLLEIQACLKKLESSQKMWSKEWGSQGYLKFISNFV